jgi:hypothetical protein
MVHLNPVRVGALELGKGQRAASRAGLAAPPSPGSKLKGVSRKNSQTPQKSMSGLRDNGGGTTGDGAALNNFPWKIGIVMALIFPLSISRPGRY